MSSHVNKAILVLDMPRKCSGCPCLQSDGDGYDWCGITDEAIYTLANIHSACPLKPLPEKRKDRSSYNVEDEYTHGWNDCLSKILGR